MEELERKVEELPDCLSNLKLLEKYKEENIN